MKVIISKSAKNFISSLDSNDKQFIMQRLDQFLQTIHNNDFNSLKNFDTLSLKGKLRGFFRLRIGKYRVIFKYSDGDMIIVNIDYRGNIY